MILFDLKCSFDHVFEAWFRDSNEFNKQRKTKLITCPVCEDTQITKSLMKPNVGKKSNASKSTKTLNKTLINKISKFKKEIEKNIPKK